MRHPERVARRRILTFCLASERVSLGQKLATQAFILLSQFAKKASHTALLLALVIEAAIVVSVSRQVRDLPGPVVVVRRGTAIERWLPPPNILSPRDSDAVID